ncbi:MAG TPA: hypothetical protein VJT49_15225 [Amycolatopsis sp.]|uniref:hypothetical protein n=1 Tax=Amycolatopsis sp. TaxID=37632 RepID=UPI002B47B63A|nr:hypothetical protein [Amycolatopsis sp.]HKS46430.1 hypothetical protein [Amycolatopsis sp.]
MTVLLTYSSSVVWETVARLGCPPCPSTFTTTIPAADLDRLASDVGARIERSAVRLAQRARQGVDLLAGLRVYERVDDLWYRRAAAVAELFRDGKVAGNAGYVDATTIQRSVVAAMDHGDGLVYELGWGQAKRPVGGLKTEGCDADLAEIVAIARLATMTRATQLLLDQPVRLRIVPGGRRFYDALFTRPEADEAYNEQRAAIATRLGHGGLITIAKDAFDDPDGLCERLAAIDRAFWPSPTQSELRFMQFAIDWAHVLDAVEAPHGRRPPNVLKARWAKLSPANRALLVRHLCVALVNPETIGEVCDHLIDRAAFADSVSWMAMTVRDSAAKYALLSQITRRDAGPHGQAPGVLRLTVMEKADQPQVPVLSLLGSQHGSFLPQHVVALVARDGRCLRFLPRMSVPDGHTLVTAALSGTEPRPLFFTDLSWQEATELLRKIDLVNMS